jgi:hypothetical protein
MIVRIVPKPSLSLGAYCIVRGFVITRGLNRRGGDTSTREYGARA